MTGRREEQRRPRWAGGSRRRGRARRTAIAALAVLAAALPQATGCGRARDLADIEESGRLVALLPYNATSYFLYRGETLGYEYEVLRAFARSRDLHLDVERVADPARVLGALRSGRGDVAGARLLRDHHGARGVRFTRGLYRTRLSVVQRDGRAVAGESAEEEARLDVRRVAEPGDLAGRTVHVAEDSAALERLVELGDELSGDVEIVEVGGGVSAETLIRRVARGEIELTATHRNLARLKQGVYRNIAVQPSLGPRHDVAVAVSDDAPELLAALDAWIADEARSELFDELYYKYFVDRRGYRERVRSRYLTSETGRLSRFDGAIAEAAAELGWDWRLLASMIFQESRFDPRARSWAGAVGLAQLMPRTARAYGVEDPTDPRQSLRGAVGLLSWLQTYWEGIPDPAQRSRFVLASYNVGQGHVADARRLAEKHGDDPDRWSDVAAWLLQKARRPVYTDPVVHYGYCRGIEPVTYVARVIERFAHYRQFVPEEPPGESTPAPEPSDGTASAGPDLARIGRF